MSQRYIGGLMYNPPGGYSGYFDGSGDYLTVPDNTAFDLGSGDFTFETWIFPTAAGTTGQFLISQWGSANYGYAISLVSSGSALTGIKFEYSQTGAVGNITARTYSQTVPLNAWSHVALVRASGTTTAYFNGAVVSTSSDNVTIYNSTATVHIAANPDGGINQTVFGYLSNLRLVKGTAVYTTAFTPPNGPLQNITNTSLLTCRYPTFVDGSSNAFTITVNGNTTVSTQNPFPLTTLPNPAQGNAGNGIFSMSQYQSLKQQNLWPVSDPYFDYTTLLLHGNGTNGAQNNTFLDSSSNNFTITRNGDTTQGTFSPFSQTGWSNYFDGSGDYLSTPNVTALRLGAGDFTIEFWANTASFGAQTYTPIVGIWDANVPSTTIASYYVAINAYDTTFKLGFSYISTGGGITDVSFGATTNGVGTWDHYAVVRSGNLLYGFKNGTLLNAGGTSITATIADGTSTDFRIGGLKNGNVYKGYISNLRVVKGTAVYTSAFTPPTAPLTAISGTSLLTCQSNRFIDNSSNAFTITPNGDTSVQAFSPFNPTAAYSAATVGGSGYFDGSGDYLSVANNTAFDMTSGDFTIEGWFYQTAAGTYPTICGKYEAGNQASWVVGMNGSNWDVYVYYGASSTLTVYTSARPVLNQWNHFALERNGANIEFYVNGSRLAQVGAQTMRTSTSAVAVGAVGAGYVTNYEFPGYISSLRIVKGTAVYSGSTYTVPTAPLTAISGTSLLTNFTNAGIIDNTAKNDLQTVGNAQISTTQSKFGGASMAFDGSGDYCFSPANPLYAFNTGDFTVEMWVYFNALASNQTVAGTASTYLSGGWQLIQLASTTLSFLIESNPQKSVTTGTLSTGQWYHIAATRSGTTLRIFVNGVLAASATSSENITDNAGNKFVVGNTVELGAGRYLNGYIDDLRITKGIARYTSNFTPQTSQWQDQ